MDLSARSGLRVRRSDETFEAARALLPRFGISRVTDITRMDRLGLPVFASIRPRGKTVRVHAGKGLTPDDARVGAAMEGIEIAIAEPERTRWQPRQFTAAALSAQLGNGLSLVDLRPLVGVTIRPDDPITAVECIDLCSGRSAFLPAQIVFLPYMTEGRTNLFGGTSNGLASGNTVEEATLHGILEIMERDAIAMNHAGDRSEWIEPATFPPLFRSLAAQWLDLGVTLQVRYVPNAFDLPCFEARLHEPASEDVNLTAGFGLHLDRSIAFNRAVCEAAQSRLSIIHGGRDDITRFYRKYDDWRPAQRIAVEADLLARFGDRTCARDFLDVPTHDVARVDVDDALSRVISLLEATGFPAIYRHRFDVDLAGLQVVKITIPRCEHMEADQKRVGRRLLARILRDD